MWSLTHDPLIRAVNVRLDTRSVEPVNADEVLRQMESAIDMHLTVPTGVWPLHGLDKLLLACRSAFVNRMHVQEQREFGNCHINSLVVEEYASYTEDDTNAMLRQLCAYLERLTLGNGVGFVKRRLWGTMQTSDWPEISIASWIVFRMTAVLHSGDTASVQLAWEDDHFNGESRFSYQGSRHFDLREFLQFLVATVYAREPELQQKLAAPGESAVIYDWSRESDAARRPYRPIGGGPNFTGNLWWPTCLKIVRGPNTDETFDFLLLHELLTEFMVSVRRICESQHV